MRHRAPIALAVALVALPAAAQDSCGRYDFATPFLAAYLAGEPLDEAVRAAETIVSLPDARCHQDRVVAALRERIGDVVGYKAGATSAGAQKQLGLSEPVLGVLLEGMILDDGATVRISDGARLIYELDLVARVGDAALNEATTRDEALAGIESFHPFIEVADLMVPQGAVLTGPLAQAINVGARFGVIGAAIPAADITEERLANVTGTLTKDGSVVAQAPASALLGDPLDAVLWVVGATRARGWTLQEGDLLSLGSLGPFQLAAPGLVSATYTGFGEEPVSISARLE